MKLIEILKVAVKGKTEKECKQHFDFMESAADVEIKKLKKPKILGPLTTKYVGGFFKEGFNTNEIIGHWHEDGSPYVIQCPPQLRPMLLWLLQNIDKIYYDDTL